MRQLAYLAVVLAGAALGPSSSPADEPPRRESGERVVLFDGKTLGGWKVADFFKPGEVAVKDGAIVLGEGHPMTGITSTRKDLPKADYELTYEARRLSGRDFFAAATFPVGRSFATFVNGGWGGNVTGLSSLDGADASENDTGFSFRFEDRRWYRFRVRVTAEVIRCAIDDKEVVAVRHRGREVGTRIEVRANQPLGFATWETAGAIRSIAVRRLSAKEIGEANALPDE